MAKSRLDQLLVTRGLVESRSKAQALVAAGHVQVNGAVASKPSQSVAEDAALEITGQEHPWVSRGGMKLAHAIEYFELDVQGKVALDIGASTGGFTDVLLHHGAAKIYAVDVGHNQLAKKLREDDRVVCMEGVNARYLTAEQVPESVDIIVCDASFISLKKLLPAAMALATESAWLVALIKPQFEVGKGNLGKGGVVRDAAAHQQVCDDMLEWFAMEHSQWQLNGLTDSPITGPDGNNEFLVSYTARLR